MPDKRDIREILAKYDKETRDTITKAEMRYEIEWMQTKMAVRIAFVGLLIGFITITAYTTINPICTPQITNTFVWSCPEIITKSSIIEAIIVSGVMGAVIGYAIKMIGSWNL